MASSITVYQRNPETHNMDNAGIENSNAEEIPTDTGNNHEEPISNSTVPESENGQGPLNDEVAIRATIRSQLDELKVKIDGMTEIPKLLLDVPLKCLKTNTIQYLSYHLDPESDIMTDDGVMKDYRGLAALIGLEDVFIRFVERANYSMLKTSEVISKWLTQTEPLPPTLGNLQKCLIDMERHDVLEDMSVKMAKDAVTWRMTEFEAANQNSPNTIEDTSWQLTRHDVVSGEKTFYTCCLLYADQDRSIAQMIIQLYKSVCPDTLFFVPQFDLLPGNSANRTTIDVIDERCGGRVIFILSEYFFASGFNQFAVEYCRNLDIENQRGDLIPFYLTNNTEHVPRLLRGLIGIRWFRGELRHRQLLLLADALLGGRKPANEIEFIRANIETLIERDPDIYLADPMYDDDVGEPGQPVPTYDPEPEVENSDNPSSRLTSPSENECLVSSSHSSLEILRSNSRRSTLQRLRHYIRKKIINFIYTNDRQSTRSRPPPAASENSSNRIVMTDDLT